MAEPIITTAGPFPNSFVGIHFDGFLQQVGVHTAPHFLEMSPQEYVSPGVFEMQRLAVLTGPVNEQRLSEKARILFDAVGRFSGPSRLCLTDTGVVVATLAHKAALYAYIAAGTDHSMYQLYARAHGYFASVSASQDEKRDHLYRAVWGYAHYAQRFQNCDEDAIVPWSGLMGALLEARDVAPPDHAEALSTYFKIAQAGPPEKPLNLEEVLKTLDPGGAGETFRGIFMTELKRFLDTKKKEFSPKQHLVFDPLELADDGSRSLITQLSVKDSSGAHHSYPLIIQVSYLSGFNEESTDQVGTTVVSIRDNRKGPKLFSE